jgi:hydroxymethylpyrimidine kinase/phosphomethylpyrimidine kinase/thiamine-phosphate diphosphorylase
MRTLADLGVHGCPVVTAVTAQNGQAVTHITPVSADTLLAQCEVLSGALRPRVIKLGLLPDAALVATLADYLASPACEEVTVVADPVCAASTGDTLMDPAAQALFVEHLLPRCDLLTPNMPEAAAWVGHPVTTEAEIVSAAAVLLERGARAVLIKGGHRENGRCADYYADGLSSHWLVQDRLPGSAPRGTGCVLASAISAAMALGYRTVDAIVIGKMYVTQGIRAAQRVGSQHCLPPLGWPGAGQDVPQHSPTWPPVAYAFPDCGPEPLGLYPVVDEVDWLYRLVPLGVTTIQLRLKTEDAAALRDQIAAAVAYSKKTDVRLFINDHWALAIEYGAYGVHLGQSDLETADLAAIARAGLRVGISTHSHDEVAVAKALAPSYIAVGPIYATDSKVMPFAPQGVGALSYWQQMLPGPLVAIGGIGLSRIAAVAHTGVSGIAMISAITQAEDVEATVRALQDAMQGAATEASHL